MQEPRADPSAVQALVERYREEGSDAVWVDRAPVYDKATLLHALYQAIPLSADFGFNWDALEDALYGPEDDNAPPRVLIFRDLELLEERSPSTARTFMDIVDTVAASPRSTLRGLVRATGTPQSGRVD